jgi:RNA-binding protein YlmH
VEEDIRQLQKRFEELAARADGRGRYTYTQFLTLAEQDVLQTMSRQLAAPFVWMGGYEAAERRLACFGREEDMGYAPQSPICCLSIAPASKKFSGDLGHRDFLGSLMALGIKRQLLGDIQIVDGVGYLFCLEEIAPYLCENLISVGRTTVHCEPCEAPEQLSQPPEPTEVVVASERLDALIAAVWRLSRSQAQELLERGMVFIDGRLVVSPSHTLREGDTVSVRHQGRFRYEGTLRETKKGRLRVCVRIW